MKKDSLLSEEKEIMAAIERDEFVPIPGLELEQVAKAIALRKRDMTLTIRVNRNDINQIKKIALKHKIPYQSYISEVIHRLAQAT